MSSNAGSTLVPPLDTRARISLTASTASTSASTDSSSQARAGVGVVAAATSSRAEARWSASAERVAHPIEDPGAVPGHRVAALLREVLEEIALPLRELRRDDDVDEHVEIAASPRSPDVGHALAAQSDFRPGLRPRLDLDLLVAVDRRHRDTRPERRLGDRHVGLVDELGALPLQLRVRRDVDRDIQAARRPAARPCLALVREPDLMALVDPRRDRHPEGPGLLDPSLAVTRRTRVLDDPPVAAAARTGGDI